MMLFRILVYRLCNAYLLKMYPPIKFLPSIKQNESDQDASFLLGNTAGWSAFLFM